MNNKRIPFPQANDFAKILLILKIEKEESLLDNSFLRRYLSVANRQINYYLSATDFLGITNGSRGFTSYGHELRKKSRDAAIVSLCMNIVGKPVFGEVFFSEYLYNISYTQQDISELISAFSDVSSTDVADRRASTVSNWLKWIKSNIQKQD